MRSPRLGLVGLLLLCAAVLALVVIATLLRLPVPSWGNPVGDSLSAEIAGDRHVGQVFAARMPRLSGIQVTLTATAPAEVVLHLRAGPRAEQDLKTWTFPVQSGAGDVNYRFDFAPLNNQKGQVFYLYLESPATQAGQAARARTSQGVILEGASAYVDGQPAVGDLQFLTFYAPNLYQKVDVLLSQMAGERPYVLGAKGLYIGLAAAYLLVLGLFLWQAARGILEERTP